MKEGEKENVQVGQVVALVEVLLLKQEEELRVSSCSRDKANNLGREET